MSEDRDANRFDTDVRPSAPPPLDSIRSASGNYYGEDYYQVRAMFDVYDTTHSGRLDLDSFKSFLPYLGMYALFPEHACHCVCVSVCVRVCMYVVCM